MNPNDPVARAYLVDGNNIDAAAPRTLIQRTCVKPQLIRHAESLGNLDEIPNVLGVGDLANALVMPRCAYVESVAVQVQGVHRAFEALLALNDHRVP